MGKETEARKRCRMDTVVDAAGECNSKPFGEERIEVTDTEARAVSPVAWLNGVKSRLADIATRPVTRTFSEYPRPSGR